MKMIPFFTKSALFIKHSFNIQVLVDTCSMFKIIKQTKEMKILKHFKKCTKILIAQ